MMLPRRLCALTICCLIVGFTPAAKSVNQPISVMVLGMYHMDNPGRDVHNLHVDDVTVPKRQGEIAALVDQLAKFNPTIIAIERYAADQDSLMDTQYPDFTPDWLTSKADERVQIGYRLARQLKLPAVYAVDEHEREGIPDYFPYGEMEKFAKDHGQQSVLDSTSAWTETRIQSLHAQMPNMSVAQILLHLNSPSPDSDLIGQQAHAMYPFLAVGKGDDLPGAELNGRWYTRNAKIFAKLMRVAKPGDRVIIMFGAGHCFWLRHFVQNTEGFRLVEPTLYIH